MASRVLLPLFEGFEDIEAFTTLDVLRRGGVEVVTAAIGGAAGGDPLSVRSSSGVTVKAERAFADAAAEDYDAIALVGGPGTEALHECEPLLARLRQQRDEGKRLAAICAAPLVLVTAGAVAPEVHLTCYPTCVMDLDRRSAGVPVVSDGGVVTGQAPGSALLFALVLLKELEGTPVADRVARGLVADVGF